jgi:glycosyltransferase involved in cell wall biosynthesis
MLPELIESRPDWSFFLYTRSPEEALDLRARFPASRVQIADVAGSPNVRRLQGEMPRRLRQDRIDLYHSLGYFVPFRWHGPRVVTIHDMNVYLNWRSWMRPGKLLAWLDLVVETPVGGRVAERIITMSEYSKQQICRLLRVPPDKVAAIPLAADPYFAQPPSESERMALRTITGGAPYVLFVGILSPQKNLATLVHAMRRSDLPSRGVKLVIAGSDREGYGAHLRRIAAEAKVDLLLPGFVTRATLRALYHGSLCVVLASFGEGFGLPVVEAFASRTPVIAADRQSLPEVVDGAGCLFDPDDTSALATLLDRMASDDAFRNDLVRRGDARAKEFSWRTTAERTARVYEEAVAARRL